MTASIPRRRARFGPSVATILSVLGGCFDPSDSDETVSSAGSTGGSETDDSAGTSPTGEPTGDPSGEPTGDPSGEPTGDPTGDATDGSESATTDDGSTADGSTDESSAGCDGGTCVPEVPLGWQGPVVVHEGAEPPPPCPGDFPMMVHDELHTGLEPGNAVCDCECEDVVGASCGAVTLEEADNFCAGVIFDPNQWILNPDNCTFVNLGPGDYAVLVPPLQTAGASCSPQQTEQIPTPTWGASVRSCAVPAGDACESGTCGPTLAAEFDALCIWIEGEASCPAGPYTEVRTAHAGFTDGRDCSACSCGDPEGVCGGEVIFADQDCDVFYVGEIAAGSCGNLGGGATHATWAPAVEAECAPSGGAVQGSAAPTGTVTFCCAET